MSQDKNTVAGRPAAQGEPGRLIELAMHSRRHNRSEREVNDLRLIISRTAGMPKLSFVESQRLATDTDVLYCPRRSILFLQGDFGDCFYVILSGAVELFVEKSKDRELQVAAQLGEFRGKPLPDPDSTIPLLGGRVARLEAGTGFGEYALLSTTHKFRGASAVVDPGSVLLVVHADCYNAVLRRHHLRQQKMAEGLHLLQNVAVFRDAGYAKLAQIAFAMKFVQVSAKTRLVCAGDAVETVYLLGTGLVSVLSRCADPSRGGAQAGGVFKSMSLAVAQWGKGFVVGERELQGGLKHFENTYETVGQCEMFEIPVQLCKEIIKPADRDDEGDVAAPLSPMELEFRADRERVARASSAVQSIFGSGLMQSQANADLLRLLPLLIATAPSATSSPRLSLVREQGKDIRSRKKADFLEEESEFRSLAGSSLGYNTAAGSVAASSSPRLKTSALVRPPESASPSGLQRRRQARLQSPS